MQVSQATRQALQQTGSKYVQELKYAEAGFYDFDPTGHAGTALEKVAGCLMEFDSVKEVRAALNKYIWDHMLKESDAKSARKVFGQWAKVYLADVFDALKAMNEAIARADAEAGIKPEEANEYEDAEDDDESDDE